ncbi:MAG: hypothetical protein V4539_09245 [Bacteroidota bacterium]
MKKIISLCCFVLIGTFSIAQSLCATINGNVVPLNPQSGAHNYFGITVTLDQTYDQNVTITGYIFDDGDYNTNTPFSLTIYAGYTSASTSTTYYQTNPTASGAVSITSISPSSITKSSVTYGTQCALTGYPAIPVVTNPNNPMDYFGSKHNDGCDAVIGASTSADILHATKVYLNAHSYDSSNFNSWYGAAVSAGYYTLATDAFANNTDSLVDILYANSLISSTVKSYLYSLVSIIDAEVGESDPSYSVYNSVASAVVSLETTIINDNSLSTSEKNGLLIGTSVVRFSGAYWGNYFLNNLSTSISPREHRSFSVPPYESGAAIIPFTRASNSTISAMGMYADLTEPMIGNAEKMGEAQTNQPQAESELLMKKYSFWKWFKRVMKGDLAGAIGGFFSGLFTGDIPGNTIGGAVAGSVLTALNLS